MGFIVAIWWCYYDLVDAAGEQMVRTRRDAVRFQVWNYGHLPLYLGIAVTGVGLEHVIAKATKEPLHTGEVAILSGAIAAITMALLLLAATRRGPRQDRSAHRDATPERRAPRSRHQSRTQVATARTALDTLREG